MANFKHISIDGASYDVAPAGSYVTGVKGSNESTYRTGNVNLSKTNVGLGNVPNVTTNNQTPTFSQASTRANIASGEKLSVLFGKIMKFFADLKTVAFTGAYSDLSGTPTIPTVNNATLTIQKNGTNVQTFTANASSNKTANITVPTKVSELTNDSLYITSSDSRLYDRRPPSAWNNGFSTNSVELMIRVDVATAGPFFTIIPTGILSTTPATIWLAGGSYTSGIQCNVTATTSGVSKGTIRVDGVDKASASTLTVYNR